MISANSYLYLLIYKWDGSIESHLKSNNFIKTLLSLLILIFYNSRKLIYSAISTSSAFFFFLSFLSFFFFCSQMSFYIVDLDIQKQCDLFRRSYNKWRFWTGIFDRAIWHNRKMIWSLIGTSICFRTQFLNIISNSSYLKLYRIFFDGCDVFCCSFLWVYD